MKLSIKNKSDRLAVYYISGLIIGLLSYYLFFIISQSFFFIIKYVTIDMNIKSSGVIDIPFIGIILTAIYRTIIFSIYILVLMIFPLSLILYLIIHQINSILKYVTIMFFVLIVLLQIIFDIPAYSATEITGISIDNQIINFIIPILYSVFIFVVPFLATKTIIKITSHRIAIYLGLIN